MKKTMGMLMTIIVLGVFVAASGSRYQAIKSRQEQAPKPQMRPPSHQIFTVGEGTGTRTVPALATLKSRATIKVIPETAGKVSTLTKREGDRVSAGEVIARIESDELQTQLKVAGAQTSVVEKQTTAAAETIRSLASQRPALAANEQFWRAEHERDQSLFHQGALSKAQWEGTANKLAEAQGRLAALDAQIRAAQAQKQAVASQKDAAAQNVALWKVRTRYAEVVAPVDGVISARLQEEGNYVTPNTVLYQLEDTRSCRLVMQIPQQHVTGLRVGQEVRLPGHTFPAFRVTRVYPTANELRQRTVEAEPVTPLSDPELERQFAVNVVCEQATGVLVPAAAFFAGGKRKAGDAHAAIAVYVASGPVARRTEVMPMLVTDSGDAVVATDLLASGTRLVRLGFLEYARLAETLSLSGAVQP